MFNKCLQTQTYTIYQQRNSDSCPPFTVDFLICFPRQNNLVCDNSDACRVSFLSDLTRNIGMPVVWFEIRKQRHDRCLPYLQCSEQFILLSTINRLRVELLINVVGVMIDVFYGNYDWHADYR